jgi:transposase
MVSKRRRFTREFKIETVRLLTGSDQSVTGVADDLGIHPNTLYKWIHQYGENPEEAFPGKGKQISEAEELSRLKRENKRLRMERDILKKAMAIFSNDPK